MVPRIWQRRFARRRALTLRPCEALRPDLLVVSLLPGVYSGLDGLGSLCGLRRGPESELASRFGEARATAPTPDSRRTGLFRLGLEAHS